MSRVALRVALALALAAAAMSACKCKRDDVAKPDATTTTTPTSPDGALTDAPVRGEDKLGRIVDELEREIGNDENAEDAEDHEKAEDAP